MCLLQGAVLRFLSMRRLLQLLLVWRQVCSLPFMAICTALWSLTLRRNLGLLDISIVLQMWPLVAQPPGG